ncbi:SDR family NAD(P)-dependent oxidoreductase [Frankia sp. CNm7]|uniref:SDR family NAD(P)-dependent oxidoreductase n=1 Tax=Frankia nepalensis TaxID=1836974 RepID=A0A937UMU8_9ACTN|nr:SDR family NAD(P)-dependent oxidoreductase [Frankia nepalensis]MBL7502240.1 SDR family NAD(P)-dependent oxidoreductase [Frankia nepalensis]MBL7515049.1 SDR family NAD(P)-dependent oxidoreductase [Frankia nepalensis]MBL7522299.1 SDR family NAD(P)-dependent oxidoreductase [Frankia nepalensis]MBL7625590.1 SDR family NAD(P)-dependent oxidoreductase [Frankia nepalensis]
MVENEFQARYGPWAVIAGASMGIGAALSHEAARRGLNVVLLARGKEQLEATAAEVAARHGVQTRTIAADLASPGVGDVVADATRDLDVGLFVYNAAVGPNSRFIDGDLDLHLLSVDVNCRTPVILCHHFGRRLVERGHGGIVMISSMGGTQGAVNFSTYNAGKGFQWILTESLWTELADRGVDAVNVFVGATSSPNYNSFQETLDPELCSRVDTDDPLDRARSRLMRPSTPEEVATASYEGLGQGPVAYTHPDDAFVSERCFALPRAEATLVWRALQETSTRRPDRVAR